MQTVDQTPRGATELIPIRGSRPLFAEEVRTRLDAGARCVRFEFCISLLVITFRRQSPVYLTNSWQERYLRGLGYSLLALLLGPWGVPWGVLWTLWAIWVNTTGGADCSDAVRVWLETSRTDSPAAQVASQDREAPSP
ncbi:MAG: hypothetical protein L0241_21165 [Planctomycetia bacterium]|nr:hypothetical protein [Planctomycetia bacterium]